MAEEVGVSEKSPNAWGQAVMAVVLVGALAGGLWVIQKNSAEGASAAADEPASCSNDKDAKPSAKRISGAQLCKALNRTDLSWLLGTPREKAQTAHGSESSVKLAGGTEIATPEATVTFETYSVKLSRSYDGFPVADMADLLGGTAQKKTIAGHPAVLYSDRTIALSFDLGGSGKASTGPGGIARSLIVAPDAKDGGGSYELAIWRQDDVVPDDAALLSVAERVLPTIPGWTTG
ncbi:DUF6215 domain-containing protein [Streptomyces sp. NBC_01275]|uniref:DUF6215 domain-containing protein n=1 Tax=Streptomyces sp. NBC_01275 TaxID=2903807 RepID=UPI002251143B|nr:DUF6215 domain-containing protein [Streptomyces sp. NBC_01275]MCX4761976.1 DUF6215 domain-containing protein [Streptomyces sp. NBC_01275]